MSPRGRPRNTERSIRIVLSGWLHPEYDADIIAWLKAIPKGARMNAFKTALRNGGMSIGTSLETALPDEARSAADAILSNWEF